MVSLTLETFSSYVTFPVGGLLLVCSMLGVPVLARLSSKVCGLRVRVGGVSIRLSTLVVIYCLCFFAFESFRLLRLRSAPDSSCNYLTAGSATDRIAALAASSSAVYLRCQAYRLRHERNWWIYLCNATVWVLLWRAAAIVQQMDLQLKMLASTMLEEKKTFSNSAHAEAHADATLGETNNIALKEGEKNE
eukprot:GHVT01004905.1.p1 GENE.GHVT01004905.1~~GHVT01004905.1.p1  ORF type:complete len:191 (-),score=49.18 GHVT01004905.1:97-669(-)